MLPIRARPRPCAHSAAMETHGCASCDGQSVSLAVPNRTIASRPAAVIRATSVPSGSSAMVRWPSTQSGPWNSASAPVIGTGSPAS